MACCTQWRYSGMGLKTGMIYDGVETVARQYGVELTAETFSNIQILENAIITAEREKNAKQN